MNLIDLWEREYVPQRLADSSASCRNQYRSNMRRFDRWLCRPAVLTDLTDDTLMAFARSIKAGGRSPATANKIRSQLVAVWRFANSRGYVRTTPTLPKLAEYKRAPLAWLPDELTRLFAACRATPGMIGPVTASAWWYALHALLWDTGARIGAVLQMTWQQVDMHGGSVILLAEHQKQSADQVFRLHPGTAAALAAIYRASQPLVFHWPKSRASLWNHYARLLRRAGLPTDRKSKFHRMRKSVASHYEANGGNAQLLLGHANRTTTLAYLDNRVCGPKHAADLLFRPDAPIP